MNEPEPHPGAGPGPRTILDEALKVRSPAERDQFLAEACRGEADLRGQVESLLMAYDPAAGAPDAPYPADLLPAPAAPPSPEESVGTMIGPYKLLEAIGEGGMGVVFAAEQSGPIRRRVALKLIKPGMDTRHVIARFDAERQALALMDHPNIARVFDAGATAGGRPYFVMELVKGLPITTHCDEACLTPRERLELLAQVCQAVQHAHHKGVIHRDLKPSNVLVSIYDGKPVPKVIDFGVAKAVDQCLTGMTLYTRHGAVVGTPEYMSPEQAEDSALDVDTRSDVYSLGVLMYELLTGTTPLGKRKRKEAIPEVLRRVREEEPQRLSLRLSTSEGVAAIAARRGTEPVKLARLLRGDLDWIAMKALEKDRSRRYTTPHDLASDLSRYLKGEPVEAGPPSATYRVGRYARRHRVALATAGAFAAVLIVAAVVSALQAVRAIREADRAVRSESVTRAALGFLCDRVLAAARPKGEKGGLGREVTLLAALDAAEPGVADALAAEPGVEATVRNALGTTYLHLGKPTAAVRQFERALTLRGATLGPDHPDTLVTMNNLAIAFVADGRAADAIPLHETNVALSRARLGPEHPETLVSLSNLASAYRLAGRSGEAIAILERLLALRRARLGPDHLDTIKTAGKLAAAYQEASRNADAIRLHEDVLRRCRAVFPPTHPEILTALSNLATAFLAANRLDDARALLKEALASRNESLGVDHPSTLTSMNVLAAAYQAQGRTDEAVPLFEECLALRKATLRPGHPDILRSMNNLAVAYRSLGRNADAVSLFQKVVAARRSQPGPRHPDTLRAMNSLADAYLASRDWASAEALARECLDLRVAVTPDDWQRYQAMSQLGAALSGRGATADAERLLVSGYEGMRARRGQIPPTKAQELTAAASRTAALFDARGLPDQAAVWRERSAASLSPPATRN